ncbi:hypothetical protein N3K66_000033 [Trichothecium roseum]|uniref:Uncharacterized protein n=1 Tax=Trichothecium roseum TaxID=47278 RepID=A0ACC0VAT5_9HYPO|nr:hypothetical protein N3K66_000033 [Trichothecium roseum]
MRRLALGIYLLGALAAARAGSPVDGFVGDLEPLLSEGARVSLPDAAAWDDLLVRASAPRVAPGFVVAVEPLTEEDISNTIKAANKFGLPFLAVSGTHGWPTSLLGMRGGGVQINMRRMNATTLGPDGTTALAGGGVMQYQITAALAAHNKRAVTGLCECVSAIGPALGGGHSMLQYQHGFAADNLVSARVVLHDGRAVTASPGSNPDLWWALRGAGHNFGVVASFETRAYDFVPDDDEEGTEETWRVDGLVFTQDKLEVVLGAWNELEAEFPDPGHLVLHGIVRLVDEIDPDHPCISLQLVTRGLGTRRDDYLARFRALSPSTQSSLDAVPWADLHELGGWGLSTPLCRKGENIVGFPDSLPSWDAAAMRAAYALFDELVTDTSTSTTTDAEGEKGDNVFSTSTWLLESYGMRGVRAVPDDANAVAPEERRLPLLTSPILWWKGDDPAHRQRAVDIGSRIRAAVRSPFSPSSSSSSQPHGPQPEQQQQQQQQQQAHSYVNYAYGDESVQEMYGRDEARLAKLRDLKRKWDPQNRFGFYNPIH